MADRKHFDPLDVQLKLMQGANAAYELIEQLTGDLALVRERRDKLKHDHEDLKVAHAKLRGEYAALQERTEKLTGNIEKYRLDPYPANIQPETLSGLATIPSEVSEPALVAAVAEIVEEVLARHTHDGDDPGDSSLHLDGGDVVAQAVSAG